MRNSVFAFIVTLALSLCPLHASSNQTTAKAELLDALPSKPAEPLTPEMRQLIRELKSNRQDATVAVRLANTYYQSATRSGELRFVGYAREVLSPWWAMKTPPIEVQVMRANLRQYVHDFKSAEDDLTAVLAREPNHPQALAIRATIYLVGADYAAARADCERLKPLTRELLGIGCSATVDALTGRARTSYEELSGMLAKHPRARPEDRLWVLTRLAEMAERIGDFDSAERRLKQALAIDSRDQFLLAGYADFLLDRNRPAEVVSLLKDQSLAAHLLLRLALAEKQLSSPEFEEHKRLVMESFDTARREGHHVHEQEESRFALHILGDSQLALKLAVSNWKVQRERRDARALLEAAIAAGERSAAAPALQWMREAGIEDVVLAALAIQLTEG